ncbi:DUF680 domain-containing protein [Mesorhizobium sp. CA13]|uniref:DUF680 domain-containing protein n=1 Tax=unclassified Mesorhizobium TaxID=325217 RepID=UPI001CCAF7C1|nr:MULTISPECIES: DUF680 domain-containing protein [unclassified Mesorhizobium]MBZ9857323.1 DUF680 domain-containing protein [Mesorhizobium sp. CA13]MBZ9967007.1 DUF680 domain-containing protein [Mesorhizobium sp. BR1-1-2]
MKKIALATAAFLAITGAALAENPNVGGSDINAIAREQLDNTHTSSIPHSAAYELLNAGSNAAITQDQAVEHRRDLFGNR